MKNVFMECINNTDYEDCMTIGKFYLIKTEDLGNGLHMHSFLDDNDEPLQSMLDRFKVSNLTTNEILIRKHTHYGLYHDVGTVLENYTSHELFEYVLEKLNMKVCLRSYLEQQIVNYIWATENKRS